MSLSIVLWLPLAAGVVGLFLPGTLSRVTAVGGALATLVLAVSASALRSPAPSSATQNCCFLMSRRRGLTRRRV